MLTVEKMNDLRAKHDRQEFYRTHDGNITLSYFYSERRWVVTFENVTWKFATTVAAVEQIKSILLKRLSKRPRADVHTEHCCLEHGCKYGDEDCSVTNYSQKQSFPCPECDDRLDEYGW
jgi:hypothetical protein